MRKSNLPTESDITSVDCTPPQAGRCLSSIGRQRDEGEDECDDDNCDEYNGEPVANLKPSRPRMSMKQQSYTFQCRRNGTVASPDNVHDALRCGVAAGMVEKWGGRDSRAGLGSAGDHVSAYLEHTSCLVLYIAWCWLFGNYTCMCDFSRSFPLFFENMVDWG